MPGAPREAATVMLLRDAGASFEVLMVARNPAGRIMGGVWALPGGAVEPADGHGARRFRTAAVRELAEETGITGVHVDALVAFARWVAPASLCHRFDTHFFVARSPAGREPVIDGVECVDAVWLEPAGALAQERSGAIALLLPTRTQLQRAGAHANVAALLASAAAGTVEAVHPRLRRPGDPADALLPGDPGYETATG